MNPTPRPTATVTRDFVLRLTDNRSLKYLDWRISDSTSAVFFFRKKYLGKHWAKEPWGLTAAGLPCFFSRCHVLRPGLNLEETHNPSQCFAEVKRSGNRIETLTRSNPTSAAGLTTWASRAPANSRSTLLRCAVDPQIERGNPAIFSQEDGEAFAFQRKSTSPGT